MSGPRRAASAEDIRDHGGVACHRVTGYGLQPAAGRSQEPVTVGGVELEKIDQSSCRQQAMPLYRRPGTSRHRVKRPRMPRQLLDVHPVMMPKQAIPAEDWACTWTRTDDNSELG
jgi:hypothetical protein